MDDPNRPDESGARGQYPTGQDRPVTTIAGNWIAGLSVTPDGRTLLWGRSMITTDLMMIENFR